MLGALTADGVTATAYERATNAAQTPARGYLSEKGAGDYGTERLTQTFAVGNVTITNNDTAAVTFAPAVTGMLNVMPPAAWRVC